MQDSSLSQESAAVQEINERHARMNALAKDALENAIRIGELLTEQRKLCKHGEWLPWLKANVTFSEKTAYRYISLHEQRDKFVSVTNLADAYRIALPKSNRKTETPTKNPHVPKPYPASSENKDERIWRALPVEFSEVGKLRAEIGKLKNDIRKLKMMLQEQPDAAKLRKKVIDQAVEMAAMRRVMKEIAKERDANQRRVNREYQEARRLLTGLNYRVIIKALHSDRSQHVSSDELAEAERLAVALRPLFVEAS
jgi:hypothetical protein